MSEGWLPETADALFGEGAGAHESYEVLTVDVPPEAWIRALTVARDRLHCTFFDWLSAVDEPGTGFRVCAHVAALGPVRRLLLRTTVPHDAPLLASAVGVYAGAAWHERETHEMFGVRFDGHPGLEPLLLPEGFEGHPLRKDFVLAARVAKAWPGAKEPGESAAGDHGGPRRRQMLPPGVPDPNEWGPLKGTLPAAPARGAAADRPRRTRAAAEGSASQAPEAPRRSRSAAEGSASQAPEAPRRARSASGGSASQRGEAGGVPEAPGSGAGPRRARSASGGSASQRGEAGGAPEAPGSGAGPRRSRSVSEGSASQRGEEAAPGRPGSAPRSPDAPWHHARPAFEEKPHTPEGEGEGTGENQDNDRHDHDDEPTTDGPEGGGQ
ncbi:NADH-quinone oxidoreductase subunit C [Streptomyces sp. NPDC047130]|uniref:NADH-quinone oxidoreductase subunit C n=1 Tax=Streptomyces sp. NPDC047130 TaxID=3155261 RepID=UPI0033C76FD2